MTRGGKAPVLAPRYPEDGPSTATVGELLTARAGEDRPAIAFEGSVWTHAEVHRESASRAAWLLTRRRPGPFHVGVLFDNGPLYAFWLGACALAGATLVGINPTRQGAELARDITHTDCQLLVTEPGSVSLLSGLAGVDAPVHVDDGTPWPLREPPGVDVSPDDTFLLLFTSGTTGAPKACICSHRRFTRIATRLATTNGLDRSTVAYQVMPMFHSNALFAGWGPTLVAGGVHAFRRRFSASHFLDDVRRFGATYFNYVGKPLSYILATPSRPDDADNPLELAFGNEGAEQDLHRFAARFGCEVVDGYGSTEAGASVTRVDGMPSGALGAAPAGTKVVDPETLQECPPARFHDGRLVNADEAIGELVNVDGAARFEGYYKNEEANRARVRHGWYWTGDLAYRDEDGWFYFAGRDFEWLRVDGENFAAAPLERILGRHGDVQIAAVYGVPDEEVGDQVMAMLQMADPERFDPAEFDRFLAAQSDLGTKWTPRYVRTATSIPMSMTNKVRKRSLRAERWECADPVWWRPRRGEALQRMTAADRDELLGRFRMSHREQVLDAV